MNHQKQQQQYQNVYYYYFKYNTKTSFRRFVLQQLVILPILLQTFNSFFSNSSSSSSLLFCSSWVFPTTTTTTTATTKRQQIATTTTTMNSFSFISSSSFKTTRMRQQHQLSLQEDDDDVIVDYNNKNNKDDNNNNNDNDYYYYDKDNNDEYHTIKKFKLKCIATSDQISYAELHSLQSTFQMACNENELILYDDESNEEILLDISIELYNDNANNNAIPRISLLTTKTNCNNQQQQRQQQQQLPFGVTGRILLLSLSTCEEEEGRQQHDEQEFKLLSLVSEYLKQFLSNEMDQMVRNEYGIQLLVQPILLNIQIQQQQQQYEEDDDEYRSTTKMKDDYQQQMIQYINEMIQEYNLTKPIVDENEDNYDDDTTTNTITNTSNNIILPTSIIEVDGANVIDYSTYDYSKDSSKQQEEEIWDTSSVLIYDNLITDSLRQRLLDVVRNGRNVDNKTKQKNNEWNDIQNGPNPNRWIRGGLDDIPDQQYTNVVSSSSSDGTCWGLTNDAIYDLCTTPVTTTTDINHDNDPIDDPIQEFEKVISKQIFPNYIVTKLPPIIYDNTISSITANAPTYNDHFDYHIDGDPMLVPPSIWSDIYGYYTNRHIGKPKFVSILLYINDPNTWSIKEYGAPTCIVDVQSNTTYNIQSIPKRCIILDQDITHTVIAPNKIAKKQPRYSIVWKLILHPKYYNQIMTYNNNDNSNENCSELIRIGSAIQEEVEEEKDNIDDE